MMVVGALAGAIWAVWSPERPLAQVVYVYRYVGLLHVGALWPQQTEAWAASDGRFAFLTLGIGLVAGVAAWYWRSVRGPVAVLALAVGGLLGSALSGLIGFVLGGGQLAAQPGALIRSALLVHAHGLYLVEAGAAVLIYTVLVAFAARDDLGRPDPGRQLDAVGAALPD